jgi:hypothetical protein
MALPTFQRQYNYCSLGTLAVFVVVLDVKDYSDELAVLSTKLQVNWGSVLTGTKLMQT